MRAVEEWPGDCAVTVEADLKVEDVAEFFGRSPTTVRAWIRAGTLDAYKSGREYRITRRALEAPFRFATGTSVSTGAVTLMGDS